MATIGPFGFIGGLNADSLTYEIGKDQMSDGQDAQVIYGTLQKRQGSAHINTSALNSGAAVIGIYDWLANAGTRYLIIICGNKIFQDATLGSSPSDITGAVSITAGNNNQHTFASLNNIAITCGGTTPDAPIKWTGSGNAAALGGSPPSGRLCVTANNFVFISGISATPSRTYWSNVSDPETWTATNFVDFRQGDGDSITALADFNQNLVIFKRRSIGLLYTQTTSVSGATTLAPLTQISYGVGCAGTQAWDHLPDGRIVFLGSNAHAYIYDGSNVTDISDVAYPESSFQSNFDALPTGRLPFAAVQCYPTRHQVWFSVSMGSSTTNNGVYVYDYLYRVWQPPFTNINTNVLEAVVDTRSTPSHAVVLCTGTYAGFVNEQDKGTSNIEASGTAIDGYGTICVVLGPDQTDFEPKSIIVPFEGQSAASALSINYGFNGFKETGQSYSINMQAPGGLLDSTFLLDQSDLAGNTIQRAVIPLQNTGRIFSIQVQVRNQSPSQPYTVHPIFISEEVAT